MRRIIDKDAELIERARLEVIHYAGQLNVALRHSWPIADYKAWVARALTVLGEYGQARQFAEDDASLAAEINETVAAVNESDEAHCGCEYKVDLHAGDKPSSTAKQIPTYYSTGRKTLRDDVLLRIYKCAVCGHTNALPDHPDELTAKLYALRGAAEQVARRAIAAGQAAPVDFTKADHLHYPDA